MRRDLEAQAITEKLALAGLDQEERAPLHLPSAREVEERVFDLFAVLGGDPSEGREALRCLFKDGTITVTPGPDGVMVARSEILPFALVMASDARPRKDQYRPPEGSVYGVRSGGSIRALYNSITLPLEVRLAA